MIEHTPYRARDQPQNGSASQDRKEIVMHKFEKRDAKSRTLVILAVVGLAAALTVGIFTAVRMIRKPAASKDTPKTGIMSVISATTSSTLALTPIRVTALVVTVPVPARTAAAIHGCCKASRPPLASAMDTVRILALAVRPRTKPSTQPVTAILMEAGSSIQPRNTGAKPIAGNAAIRITNTPATA